MQLGLFSILGLIFIVLKLLDVIAWSWLWVLAPFWGGFILTVVLIFAFGLFAVWAGKR